MRALMRLVRVPAVVVLAVGTLAVGTAGASAAQAERAETRALPTCDSWTDVRYGSTSYVVHIPSVGRQSGQTNCELGVGDATPALRVLHDALTRCNGQQIVWDGIYGARFAQAVKNVQLSHGIPATGRYGPPTRDVMTWPKYTPEGSYAGCQV